METFSCLPGVEPVLGLEVIKLEYSLKIKCNDWLLADTENELKLYNLEAKTLVKSAQRKFNFVISQPKHMLWVLKRTVSMKRFF